MQDFALLIRDEMKNITFNVVFYLYFRVLRRDKHKRVKRGQHQKRRRASTSFSPHQ